jgi:hypothetical protein
MSLRQGGFADIPPCVRSRCRKYDCAMTFFVRDFSLRRAALRERERESCTREMSFSRCGHECVRSYEWRPSFGRRHWIWPSMFFYLFFICQGCVVIGVATPAVELNAPRDRRKREATTDWTKDTEAWTSSHAAAGSHETHRPFPRRRRPLFFLSLRRHDVMECIAGLMMRERA